MDTQEIVDLLTTYRDSIESGNREDVFMITTSVDSIISDYFPNSKALKSDLDYVRKRLGQLIGVGSDTHFLAGTLQKNKEFFTKYLNTLIIQISKLGVPNKNKKTDNSVKVNVSQNQSQEQNQSQKLVLEIFIESIKDEITGKQLKELKAIVSEEKEPQKAKNKILDKLSSFGIGICSNILTNIISNPIIWASLV